MNYAHLRALLVPRGRVHEQTCVRLSATKFIRSTDWATLKSFEQEYLRCYAAATTAHKAVLVGRSAARVAGLWVVPAHSEVVELAQLSGRPPSTKQWPRGVRYHHMPVDNSDYRELSVEDGTGASTLRITRAQRTIVDVARLHGLRHGVIALDSWMSGETRANTQIQKELIASAISRLAGKKGIFVARQALALSSKLSESPYESLFRVILAEHGITAQPQMWIGRRNRVDLLWGQLVIEIDGESKYEDVPHETVLKQLKRENWIKEQGYEVLRLFPADILRDEEGCVRRVIEAKARADRRGPVLVAASQKRPF